MQVQVLLPAPRQNKAARSCGGTSTATSTGDLVFPFPSQTHSVGLCDGTGSDFNCPGAPCQKNSAPFRFRGLRKSRENCTSAESFFLSETGVSRGTPVSGLIAGSDLDCTGAPRQNKAIRSCGGTCTATSTDDLVFPSQPRSAAAGLASDCRSGSDLDYPGAPERARDDWVLPARRAAAATAHKGAKPNQKVPSPRREVQRFRRNDTVTFG